MYLNRSGDATFTKLVFFVVKLNGLMHVGLLLFTARGLSLKFGSFNMADEKRYIVDCI